MQFIIAMLIDSLMIKFMLLYYDCRNLFFGEWQACIICKIVGLRKMTI